MLLTKADGRERLPGAIRVEVETRAPARFPARAHVGLTRDEDATSDFDFSDTDSNIHDTDSDFNDTIALSDTLFQCDGITLVLRDVGILAASSRYHEAGRQAPMRPSRPSLPCPNVRVGAAIMETL